MDEEKFADLFRDLSEPRPFLEGLENVEGIDHLQDDQVNPENARDKAGENVWFDNGNWQANGENEINEATDDFAQKSHSSDEIDVNHRDLIEELGSYNNEHQDDHQKLSVEAERNTLKYSHSDYVEGFDEPELPSEARSRTLSEEADGDTADDGIDKSQLFQIYEIDVNHSSSSEIVTAAQANRELFNDEIVTLNDEAEKTKEKTYFESNGTDFLKDRDVNFFEFELQEPKLLEKREETLNSEANSLTFDSSVGYIPESINELCTIDGNIDTSSPFGVQSVAQSSVNTITISYETEAHSYELLPVSADEIEQVLKDISKIPVYEKIGTNSTITQCTQTEEIMITQLVLADVQLQPQTLTEKHRCNPSAKRKRGRPLGNHDQRLSNAEDPNISALERKRRKGQVSSAEYRSRKRDEQEEMKKRFVSEGDKNERLTEHCKRNNELIEEAFKLMSKQSKPKEI